MTPIARAHTLREMMMRGSFRGGPAGSTEVVMAKSNRDPVCLCGCGGRTKGGTFLPGHDGRLHGKLVRKEIRGTSAQRAWFKQAHG